MKLPVTSTLPQWALDLCAVATEEPVQVHSVETAGARRQELLRILQNPDLLYVIGQMAKELLQVPMTVENAALTCDADVYAREQLIGEGRGLRRFFVEIEEIFETFRKTGSV